MIWQLSILNLLLVAVLGQTAANPSQEGWSHDYRDGLRLELVEGDLAGAATAYRRVLVSPAPAAYKQRARSRLMRVLEHLGRAGDEPQLVHEALPADPHAQQGLDHPVGGRLDCLSRVDSREIAGWLRQLHQALAGQEAAPVLEAARRLATAEGPRGVRELLKVYAETPSSHLLRSALLEPMGESGWPEAVDVIRDALRSEAAPMLGAAAVAAGTIGDAASGERLVALLSHEDAYVRRRAAEGLARLRHAPATDRLIEMAAADPNGAVREAASDALHCIGTAKAWQVAAQHKGEPDGRCEHTFSEWYRQACRPDVPPQSDLTTPHEPLGADRAPRIGVVVSAMTHHAPANGNLPTPYLRQIRKAWVLQRAGFDVVLLGEPEVPADPAAQSLGQLFEPPVSVHALGEWPACDAIVLDQVHYLSAPVVATLAGYVQAGGRLLLCGAVGGGWCGDAVTWRRMTGVRHPHAHSFRDTGVWLAWQPDVSQRLLPMAARADWSSERGGTFFAHDTLAGDVIGTLSTPPVWAIRLQAPGRGKVMCINWDIGQNTDGSRDEDQLFARCLDVLLDARQAGGPLRCRMMRSVRWGRLAMAKESVSPATLAGLPQEERIEVLLQLYRVYLLEHNRPAGEAVCRQHLSPEDAQGRAALAAVAAAPARLQVALDGGAVWWRDVPDWLITAAGAPLWVAGPAELPSVVRVRVMPRDGSSMVLVVRTPGAKVVRVRNTPGVRLLDRQDETCRIERLGGDRASAWIEMEVRLTQPAARVQVECESGV